MKRKSLLETTVDGFYTDLDALDVKATRKLQAGLSRAIDALQVDIAKLESGISVTGITDSQAFQYTRMQLLVGQAAGHFGELGAITGEVLKDSQNEAVALAQKHVADVVAISPTGLPRSFATLPYSAIEQVVGSLGDGSPLRSLTQSLAGDAANTVNRLLLEGVALGRNPRDVARRITKEVGESARKRSLTIARTEMMRTYRESNRRTMIANQDVIKGWIWYSTLDAGTCPVCWAMHGKKFPLRHSMATHPNCRCTMVPETYTWKELGFDFDEPELDERFGPGEPQFSKLPPAVQKQVLGRGGYNAWSNKLVTLDDFVQETYSPAWGYGRNTKSLRKMLGPDNAKLLSEGKIPTNFNIKEFAYDPPNFADPYIFQKTKLDDLVTSGKIEKTAADDLLAQLNKGSFTDPADMDAAIDFLVTSPKDEVFDLLADAYTDHGIFTKNQFDIINEEIKNATTKAELDNWKKIIEDETQIKLGQFKADFLTKKQEFFTELEKAKKYHNIGKTDADILETAMKNWDYSPANKKSLNDQLLDLKTKNSVQDTLYQKFDDVLDEAYSNLLVDDVAYGIIKNDIKMGAVDHRSLQGFIDHYEKLITKTKPISGSPLTYAPTDWAKVTDLFNAGKLPKIEYDDLYDQFYNGFFSPNDFTDYVDNLVIQKQKVLKSSSQLMAEFDATQYPAAYKKAIKQQYQSKTIDKIQMQDIIDKAPSPTTKIPGVKTPYKKHVQALDSLKSQGVIDQNYYDQIMEGYAKGYLKNADVEKLYKAKANQHIQNIQGIAGNAPHPRIHRQQWDSNGWIQRRGRESYEEWERRSGGVNTRAIRSYTGSLYDELNKWHRMGRPDQSTWAAGSYRSHTVADLAKYSREIDKALTTTSMTEDIVVIRNSRARTQYAPDWVDPQPGKLLWDEGYMSTSADTSWTGFSSCGSSDGSARAFQLVMTIPAGTPSLYIAPISGIPREYEVMIPRGQKFEILEVEDFTDSCGHVAKRIFARLLP